MIFAPTKICIWEEEKGMKCLFKHEISLDDVGAGAPDDPFPFYVAANTVRLIFLYPLYIFLHHINQLKCNTGSAEPKQ